jgi:hypothetical protein
MRKRTATFFALSLLLLWAGNQARSTAGGTGGPPVIHPGNIADGMYTIVGEASKRCLEVPNNSCASAIPLQTFDCDRTNASNNQKFNVVSDGPGNYTISPAHSDLCLEVAAEKYRDHIPVIQAECVPGKASQKWSMSQYGANLEIRDVQSNHCLDVERKATANYAPVNLQPCSNGTNQRWRLNKATINVETGVLCRSSPAHPERECMGVNDRQKSVHLGKTLTKTRCEDVCKVNRMVSCQWGEAK